MALDLLRALAVLLVLLHHAPEHWMHSLPLPEAVSSALVRGGWLGVDLFFVLSGYLISGLLFREYQSHGKIRVGRFLVRRGLKIYPAFYLFLAVTVGVVWLERGRIPSRTWSEVVFLQPYFGGNWGHTWSLGVEEHFYLALPLVLLAMLRLRRQSREPFAWIPALALAIGLLSTVARSKAALTVDFDPMVHFKPTHLRMDGLMFGVLLSYLHHFRRGAFESFCNRHFGYMLAAGVWLWIPAFLRELRSDPFLYSLGFTQFYLGAGLVLAALVVRGVPSNRLVRGVARIGACSYSIYLWHLPVRKWGMVWIEEALPGPMSPGLELAVYLATSLALGVVLTHLVELPVLRIRDRYLPSRDRPARRPRDYVLPRPRRPREPLAPATPEASSLEPMRAHGPRVGRIEDGALRTRNGTGKHLPVP